MENIAPSNAGTKHLDNAVLATLATIQNHSVGKPSGQLGYPGLTFLIQRLSEVFEDAGGNSPCSSQFTLTAPSSDVEPL